MRKQYLLIDHHNGHIKTYHPIFLNMNISQEAATTLMKTIAGHERCGVSPDEFCQLLASKGFDVTTWDCPCCGNYPEQIIKPTIEDWHVLDLISGNY